MTTGITKIGSEFQVNSTTSNYQFISATAALENGGYVITWTDLSASGGDNFGSSIQAQMYNADGTAFGTEFLVNTTTINDQNYSQATGLSNGGFVIVWTDFSISGDDTSGTAIRAQIYNAAGTPVGGEFVVPSTTANFQYFADVTALENGGFAVTWQDQSGTGDDTDGFAVRARIFAADGTALASDFVVNTTTSSSQDTPAITALQNGNFVVSWTDLSGITGDTSSYAVRAQIIGADGSFVSGEFLVNTSTFSGQNFSDITGLVGGGFVVTWKDNSKSHSDTSASAIFSQMFDANGNAVGAEEQVNSLTFSAQEEPSIAGLSDGGYIVVWQSYLGDGVNYGIVGQRFNSAGDKVGGETVINTYTTEGQQAPSVAATADGGFIVSWDSLSQDGSADGVYAQKFGAEIFGGEYRDKIHGSDGDEWIVGLGGKDTIRGKVGDDKLYGNRGSDELYGGKGDDKLFGGKGGDSLYGGNGSDKLSGSIGNDVLDGGAGKDILIGGSGADTFVFHTGESTPDAFDVIKDFVSGEDTIDLTNLSSFMYFRGTEAFEGDGNDEFRVVIKENGIQVRVDLDGDGSVDMKIFLEGATTISMADFDYFFLV